MRCRDACNRLAACMWQATFAVIRAAKAFQDRYGLHRPTPRWWYK